MRLHYHLLQLRVGCPGIFQLQAREQRVGREIVSFESKSELNAVHPFDASCDFNPFTAPRLGLRILDSGLSQIQLNCFGLAVNHHVVTCGRWRTLGIVERKALAILQEKALHVAGRQQLKLRGGGPERDWSTLANIHLNVGRLCVCSRFRVLMGTTGSQQKRRACEYQ